jgi:plastocyanin
MKYAVIALAASLLLACPGPRREDYSQAGPAQSNATSATTATTVTQPAANPAAPPQKELPSNRIAGAANQTVDVQLLEYSIRVPQALPAGTYTFNIVNSGKTDHSFVIEGNGLHLALAEPLKRGDKTQLGVELRPGVYEIYCPVDEHRGKGMETRFTVK